MATIIPRAPSDTDTRPVYEQRAARKAARAASVWRRNEELERLAALSDAERGRLSASLRMSLGYYLSDKARAAEAGVDVDNTGGGDA